MFKHINLLCLSKMKVDIISFSVFSFHWFRRNCITIPYVLWWTGNNKSSIFILAVQGLNPSSINKDFKIGILWFHNRLAALREKIYHKIIPLCELIIRKWGSLSCYSRWHDLESYASGPHPLLLSSQRVINCTKTH